MRLSNAFLILTLLSASAFAHELVHEIDIGKFFSELQGQIGYEGTDINGKGKSLDELESMGVQSREGAYTKGEYTQGACTKSDCNVSSVLGSSEVVKRQEKLEEIKNKGFLDKALHTARNADKEFDYLSGTYQGCTPTEEIITEKTVETCDQYYKMEENSCFPKQIVEIDPKYHYSCNKKREVKEKTCSDSITSIKCENSTECDLGGIQPGSVASDMMFHNEKGILTIGTIADNYWSGNCQLYDKNTSFKLKNIHLIKDFTIFNVGFDDYMEILVNGKSVYAGPDGGQNLQIVSRKKRFGFGSYVNNGHSDQACERGSNWNFNVNIDLKPHLKEGENNIRIRVIVSGNGEGWLKIRAKQNCCNKWDIKREEKCEYQ